MVAETEVLLENNKLVDMYYKPIAADYFLVSPKQYLRLLDSSPSRIVESNFVPPKLGDSHLGVFKIKLEDAAK